MTWLPFDSETSHPAKAHTFPLYPGHPTYTFPEQLSSAFVQAAVILELLAPE